MSYFLIECDEDGEISVCKYKKEELLDLINDNDDMVFMSEIIDSDPNYWGNKCLIIEGEIILPKPKTVVKEYDI